MLALMALSVTLGAPTGTPSVLVFPVDIQGQARPGLQEVLSQRVLSEVRSSGGFSKVASLADLETVVDVQRQRQLLDCDGSSCWSEVAGALGTDAFLRVSVGMLDERFIVDARLVSTRSATVLGAATGKTCDLVENALESVTGAALAQVFTQARIQHRLASRPLVAACASVAGTPEESSRPVLPLVAGAGALAGSLVAVLATGAAVATTAALFILPTLVYVPTPVGNDQAARRVFLDGTVFASGGVGVVALGVAVLLAVLAGIAPIVWVLS